LFNFQIHIKIHEEQYATGMEKNMVRTKFKESLPYCFQINLQQFHREPVAVNTHVYPVWKLQTTCIMSYELLIQVYAFTPTTGQVALHYYDQDFL
jgi:hypothetical protein